MALKVIKQESTGNVFVDTYRIRRNESCSGRKYTLKGLYTFLNSGDAPLNVDVPERIRKDLSLYEEHCERKKKEWENRKRESKLEKQE
jgi:hypothetical protein